MPSYKLIYFNSRGRAEETRLLFAAAGVKYEDCRLNGEEFAKLKAGGTLPFGQLPVLEVNGKMLTQSITIFKYVARELGFAPTDSFELAKADMIVDGLMDMIIKIVEIVFEKDEEKKKALEKTFYEKDLSVFLEPFEKLLKSNPDEKYFVGNKMTFADVKFFTSVDCLFPQDRKEDVPAALNDFPLLKDLFIRVLANPGIKEWLKKRPVTPM